MKKLVYLCLIAGCFYTPAFSQEDDLYFIPSKAKKEKAKEVVSEYSQIENEADYRYDASKNYSDKDIDLYNRRYVADSIPEAPTNDAPEDGTYTSRIIRFHSPTVGVIVSSPYYIDYYDWMFTFDPWGYRYLYDPWHHWSYYPSYYWGYNYYWNPWYYGPGWGIYPPRPSYYGPIYYSGRPSYAYRGPGNRYGGRGGSGVTRPSSRYFSTYQPSKDKHEGRPGTSRYSSSRNDKNSGTQFRESTTRPSRSFSTQKGSSQPRTNSRPSSTYTPSRSFGNTPSYSAPSGRSGGRSFGSGSRGGRR